MTLSGAQTVLPVLRQAPAETAMTQGQAPYRFEMRCHRPWGRVVGGIIWLVVVIYVLWLGTRFVRAVEKWADRQQRPGS